MSLIIGFVFGLIILIAKAWKKYETARTYKERESLRTDMYATLGVAFAVLFAVLFLFHGHSLKHDHHIGSFPTPRVSSSSYAFQTSPSPIASPAPSQTVPSPAIPAPSLIPFPSSNEMQDYVLNNNTGRFHYPDCSSVANIAPQNYEEYFGDREDLLNRGFEPCKFCKP